ncbi:MAG: GGDEF domain-containing phosphodiesterase, partial [Pseudomonadota bacterium]
MVTQKLTRLTDWYVVKMERMDWAVVFPLSGGLAWAFGQTQMALMFAIPGALAFAVFNGLRARKQPQLRSLVRADHQVHQAELNAYLDDVLDDCAASGRTTAVLLLHLKTTGGATDDQTPKVGAALLDKLVPRVQAVLRGGDAVFRTDTAQLTVVLAPTQRADLDVLMNIVDRLQSAIAEPIARGGHVHLASSCVGICSEGMVTDKTGAGLMAAAGTALSVAVQAGDDAVRTYSADLQPAVDATDTLSDQVADALSSGAITAWFQPQVDVQTGRLVGFEAMARWDHPDLGKLPAAKFLHAVHAAGLISQLGEAILGRALAALKHWDEAGVAVPLITFNLSQEELTNPRMAERLIWQTDRAAVPPHRLACEIPDSMAHMLGDEAAAHNISTLAAAGFQIDLDGFGTGSTSIAQLRRFGIRRVKLAAELVRSIDTNDDKARMVRAILGLRHDLDIETIATGAETEAERDTLTRLGCHQMQGFGVA